jgi:hypothetical protein
LYVFAVRFAGFTDTLTEPGVVPVGVTESHDPPDVVAAVAVKLVPAVPPTVIDCATGVVLPI